MSVEAMAQVWKLDLPREQKLVLMAFADHANDSGYTYPSIARVAWKCGYQQPRTVSAIIQKLVEASVLELLEKARGRTPTLYRIRWDQAPKLPEFDPRAFKGQHPRGAENAPLHEPPENPDSTHPKSLKEQGENGLRGAENAPQEDGVRKTHPKESVGVRSEDRRGAFSARRGAVASAPEPLTINQRGAGARAMESRTPALADSPGFDAELRKMNNSARLLGIEPKLPNETVEHFEKRLDAAHGRKLQAELERQTDRVAAAQRRAEASG